MTGLNSNRRYAIAIALILITAWANAVRAVLS